MRLGGGRWGAGVTGGAGKAAGMGRTIPVACGVRARDAGGRAVLEAGGGASERGGVAQDVGGGLQRVGQGLAAARAVLWWLHTRTPSKAVVTGPTSRQVDHIVWNEIRHAYTGSEGRLGGRMFKTSRYEVDDRTFAIGFATNSPYNLQGFHSPNLLVVITEAHAVSDGDMDGLRRLNPARLLMTGNPFTSAGAFYDSHHLRRELYRRVRISAVRYAKRRGGARGRPWDDHGRGHRGPEGGVGGEERAVRWGRAGRVPRGPGRRAGVAAGGDGGSGAEPGSVGAGGPRLRRGAVRPRQDGRGAEAGAFRADSVEGLGGRHDEDGGVPARVLHEERRGRGRGGRPGCRRRGCGPAEGAGFGPRAGGAVHRKRAGADSERFYNRAAEVWWKMAEAYGRGELDTEDDRALIEQVSSRRRVQGRDERIRLQSKSRDARVAGRGGRAGDDVRGAPEGGLQEWCEGESEWMNRMVDGDGGGQARR